MQQVCSSLDEGKTLLNNISDNGDGWAVGVFDAETNVLFLDGFDDIIGADPARVESRVLRDLKAAGMEPVKIEKLHNQPHAEW